MVNKQINVLQENKLGKNGELQPWAIVDRENSDVLALFRGARIHQIR
jgi:hypothetical protein